MQRQKTKKKIIKRRSKQFTSSQKDGIGYQADNCLTRYFEKNILKNKN
tara:strand:+ start:721 stop:864 length:144 start_codon:yes stop_codon:yes gene_type:complete